MDIKPITPRQKSLIINSFKRVFRTGDIEHLTSSAYRYIYLASGFIAHCNIHGFRDAYHDVRRLKDAILSNADGNSWRNFQPGDENYDYYKSKADVYRELLEIV